MDRVIILTNLACLQVIILTNLACLQDDLYILIPIIPRQRGLIKGQAPIFFFLRFFYRKAVYISHNPS